MKDFREWHETKTHLECTFPKKFNERDIWWCSVGHNVGFEQDGKNELFERPVLIIRKYNSEVFLGAPLTSSTKDHPLRYPYMINDVSGAINLTQCRTWSAKRLLRRMGCMSHEEMGEICTLLAKDLLEKAKAPHEAEQSRAP